MIVQLHELVGVGISSGWPDTSMYLCKQYVYTAMLYYTIIIYTLHWAHYASISHPLFNQLHSFLQHAPIYSPSQSTPAFAQSGHHHSISTFLHTLHALLCPSQRPSLQLTFIWRFSIRQIKRSFNCIPCTIYHWMLIHLISKGSKLFLNSMVIFAPNWQNGNRIFSSSETNVDHKLVGLKWCMETGAKEQKQMHLQMPRNNLLIRVDLAMSNNLCQNRPRYSLLQKKKGTSG